MTPAPFNIRQLTAVDVASMHSLMTMFGSAFNEVETYTGARPRQAYFERLLGSDSFIAIAAFKNDAVVGGLAAYELKKFERERSEIYIYDLAVDAAHRREGIATALILELKKSLPRALLMSSSCKPTRSTRRRSRSIRSSACAKMCCTSTSLSTIGMQPADQHSLRFLRR
jgi:ribosomal protein S18 acetylase RimI-like enzyme